LQALASQARLCADKNIKIGVLNDMSSLYADIGGPNSLAAVKMRSRIPASRAKGWNIQVLSGDHQNNPMSASTLRGNGLMPRRSTPLPIRRARRRARREQCGEGKELGVLNSGAATADLHRQGLHANTVSFTYDTYHARQRTGKALTKAGGDSWFFSPWTMPSVMLLERDTTSAVIANGGKVIGGVKHPLNTSDFSSSAAGPVLEAKIIGLANAGGDTTNSIKQAAEFGVVSGGQKLASAALVHQRRGMRWA